MIALVQVAAAQIPSIGVESRIDLPGVFDSLMMPGQVIQNATLMGNNAGNVYAIRIDTPDATQTPWGLASYLFRKYRGKVSAIYVTLLSGTPNVPLYLYAGKGAELEFSGYTAGAGTPDNSTTNAL